MAGIGEFSAARASFAGLVLSGCLCASPLHAQSFDCTKAHSDAEHAICGDKALGKLDETLAADLKAAMANAPASKAALLADERHWIAERDRKCHGQGDALAACLTTEMNARIAVLQSGAAVSAGSVSAGGAAAQGNKDDRFSEGPEGIVVDHSTGLQWTKSDGTGDDQNWFTWEDAGAYCAKLSQNGRGWRLPAVDELASLISGEPDPECGDDCIGSPLFEIHEQIWSSEPAGARGYGFMLHKDKHWEAYSGDGRRDGAGALCVRGQSSRIAAERKSGRFALGGHATVLDRKTGLQWTQAEMNDGAGADWVTAGKNCAALSRTSKAGGGWRLPTVDELTGLYDPTGALQIGCFRGMCKVSPLFVLGEPLVWTNLQKTVEESWYLDLMSGERHADKGSEISSLCVRGGSATADSGSVADTAPMASAPAQPGNSFRDCRDCPEMAPIPAGSFLMGSPLKESERDGNEGPQHKVWITAFAIGKYDVTFDEWDACVAQNGCTTHLDDAGWGRGRRPAINLTLEDAEQYARWLSGKTGHHYRLPTEAEWEYAARGGTTTAYWWGDAAGSGKANCLDCGSQWGNKQTAPVGSFPPNPFGLYDMLGNVWQWNEDTFHDDYIGAPVDGSAWKDAASNAHVMRGGAWTSYAHYLRAANRAACACDASHHYNVYGFRVVRID